jgi:hypothetical protein
MRLAYPGCAALSSLVSGEGAPVSGAEADQPSVAARLARVKGFIPPTRPVLKWAMVGMSAVRPSRFTLLPAKQFKNEVLRVMESPTRESTCSSRAPTDAMRRRPSATSAVSGDWARSVV